MHHAVFHFPTSCNYSSGAVSWAFLGNSNDEKETKDSKKGKGSRSSKQEKVNNNDIQDPDSSTSPQKNLRLQLKEAFGASFPLINGVTRMKIFCETKHLSTLAEELWRTASTRFLVKTITIWSQLL